MLKSRNKSSLRRQSLMSCIPGSFTWILSSMLALVVTVMASYRSVPPPAVESTPLPVQVEARIVTQGYDRQQRPMPFTVYVLSQQLSWKLESATDLEGGQKLLSPELIQAINDAPEVFCVGTASFEGATQTEEARAAQRAQRLADWVGAVIRDSNRTRLFTLNAGQYKGPKELESAFQRKAIIMVSGPHDKGVNLTEGLMSGLMQKKAFQVVYSLLHHYSKSNEWVNALDGSSPAILSQVRAPSPRLRAERRRPR
jgi:hypothetical protein